MKLENVKEHKVSAFCALQLNAYTHHPLTILVLTSFSIALTSSAALGTSVDPCRDASNAQDCKSPANELRSISEEAGREIKERTERDIKRKEY